MPKFDSRGLLAALLAVSLSPALAAAAGPADAGAPAAKAKGAPAAAAGAKKSMTPEEIHELLKKVDAAQSRGGDFKAQFLMQSQEKGKQPVLREMVIFNQHGGRNMVLMFTRPKTEEGKGYLLLDANVWYYDPSVGKWDRRTERDRIGGSASRRADYDAPHYSEGWGGATFEGVEKVNGVDTVAIRLKVLDEKSHPYPMLKIWIDPVSYMVVKEEDYALSGKLMRKGAFSNFQKIYSPAKKGDIWYPAQLAYESEVDGVSTIAKVKSVDVNPHPENTFTKAWLEAKSR